MKFDRDKINFILDRIRLEDPDIRRPFKDSDVPAIEYYISSIVYAAKKIDIDIGIDEDDLVGMTAAIADANMNKLSVYVRRRRTDLSIFDAGLGNDEEIMLDDIWRQKSQSYLSIIREIVRKANIDIRLRESINGKLVALSEAIEEGRTTIDKITGVFVDLCKGLSAGAKELAPALRLIERLTGAVARLVGNTPILSLPPPDGYGLSDEPVGDD